jgi:uncharacterized membrane protein
MRTIAVNLVSGTVPTGVLAAYLGDRFQANLLVATASAVAFVTTILAALPEEPDQVVPVVGVVVSVLLAIASLAALLYAMTHSVATVDASRLVRAISGRALAGLGAEDVRDDGGGPPDRPPDHVLLSPATGWVGRVDTAAVLSALPAGACAVVDVAPGDFVIEGTRIGGLWDGDGAAASPDRVTERLVVRANRAEADDVVLAVDRIVDIGSRALRARARDMTLAREAVGHLGLLLMSTMERRGAGSRTRRGDDGALVVVTDHLAWPDLLRRAFDPLRIDGARWPVVAHQLVSTLGAIHDRRRAVGDEGAARDLRQLARATVAECRAGQAIEADVQEVVEHARRLGLIDVDAERG